MVTGGKVFNLESAVDRMRLARLLLLCTAAPAAVGGNVGTLDDRALSVLDGVHFVMVVSPSCEARPDCARVLAALTPGWEAVGAAGHSVWRADCGASPAVCRHVWGRARLATVDFAALDGGGGAGAVAVEHHWGAKDWPGVHQFVREVSGHGGLLPWSPAEAAVAAAAASAEGTAAAGECANTNSDDPGDGLADQPLVLLFLTTNGLERPRRWCEYLRTARRPFRAYAHDKRGPGPADSYCGAGGAAIVRVPPVPTQRMTISMPRAVIQLLRRALADGPAARYVLLSGDTVPLTPFDAAYAAMTNLSERGHSIFERFVASDDRGFDGLGGETAYRHSLLRDDGRARPSPAQYLKTSSWVALSEVAARWFAEPANDHTRTWEHSFGCDEHYWVALSEEFGLPWREGPTVHARWRADHRGHPETLREVGAGLAAELVRQGYHFARKVTAETRLAPLVAPRATGEEAERGKGSAEDLNDFVQWQERR